MAAGSDMALLVTNAHVPDLLGYLADAVTSHQLDETQINRSVQRVLGVKAFDPCHTGVYGIGSAGRNAGENSVGGQGWRSTFTAPVRRRRAMVRMACFQSRNGKRWVIIGVRSRPSATKSK